MSGTEERCQKVIDKYNKKWASHVPKQRKSPSKYSNFNTRSKSHGIFEDKNEDKIFITLLGDYGMETAN